MPISAKLLSKIKSGKFRKKELILEDRQISDKECQELVNVLNLNDSITSLDLSNNLDSFGDEGYKALSELKYIKTLNLSFNQISIEAIKHLNKNSVFDTLYMERCYLSAEHMAELAKHPSITRLYIPFNSMWAGSKADYFKDNKTITELDISSNILHSEDLDEISSNQTIRELCLYQNALTDDCVSTLLKMPSLTHVDLRSNDNMSAKAVTFLYSELSKRPNTIEIQQESKMDNHKSAI